jgi:hypothetical protein
MLTIIRRDDCTERHAIEHAYTCSKYSLHAKAKVGHSQRETWVEDDLTISLRKVRRYMRVAKCWETIQTQATSTSHLTVPLPEVLAIVAETKLVIEEPSHSETQHSSATAGAPKQQHRSPVFIDRTGAEHRDEAPQLARKDSPQKRAKAVGACQTTETQVTEDWSDCGSADDVASACIDSFNNLLARLKQLKPQLADVSPRREMLEKLLTAVNSLTSELVSRLENTPAARRMKVVE